MKNKISFSVLVFGIVLLLCLLQAGYADAKCPSNMVAIGNLCVDRYEASVWSSPDKNGTPQGTQFGVNDDDYPCSDNGNDCSRNMPGKIFAASISGVEPSGSITWFQAQQACANVGKRLLTNAEWQMAAAGTPDPGSADDGSTTCSTLSPTQQPSLTGSRAGCVSNWGAYDMVGNVFEWVADWMQNGYDHDGGFDSTDLYGQDEIVGVDEANPEADRFPAALVRGGDYGSIGGGYHAGVFALLASESPSNSWKSIGFRCAR